MDPRDPLCARLAGVGCTACGSIIGAERIRTLAGRDELTFVELHCLACGTRAVGLVIEEDRPGSRRAVLDLAPYGEFGPADEARLATRRPLDVDDVLAMHALLRGHRGGIRELLGEPLEPAARPG